MRRALMALLGALLLVPAAAAITPQERAMLKVGEAKRLEQQAFELFKANTADPKPDELVSGSIDLLKEADAFTPIKAKLPVHGAIGSDRAFLRYHKAGDAASAYQQLELAILIKDAALRRIEESTWPPAPVEKKATPATPVPAPSCKFVRALAVTGCSGTAFWDINVAHDAKRARCTFTGPAGETSIMRPLFPKTVQVDSCKLTNKFRTVDGVRKRIVHAELTITVPQGVTARGSKSVRVTAYWQ